MSAAELLCLIAGSGAVAGAVQALVRREYGVAAACFFVTMFFVAALK